MGDNYKFEMLRSDDAAQVTMAFNVRVKGVLASEVTATFVNFLMSCGYHSNTVKDALQEMVNELS